MFKFKIWLVLILILLNLAIGDTWESVYCPYKIWRRTAACRVGRDSIFAWIGPLETTKIRVFNVYTHGWSSIRTPGRGKRSPNVCMTWDSINNRVHILYIKQADDKLRHMAFRVSDTSWCTLPPPTIRYYKIDDRLSNNDMVWVRYNDSSYLFVLSRSRRIFWRYNINFQSWTLTCSLPREIERGAALCWNGVTTGNNSFLYIIPGGNKKEFYRFTVPNGGLARLKDLPFEANCASLAYRRKPGGDTIYAFINRKAVLDTMFRAYNVNADSWEKRKSMPKGISEGSALVYLPFRDRLYAFRGGEDNKDFWRYVFSGQSDEGNEGTIKLIAGFDELEKDEPEIGIEDVQDPSWSNDGQWIIFSKYDTITGSYQIFKRRPDGSEETQITFDESDYTEPKWAPDSNLIACIIDDKLGLIKPDGSGKVILDKDEFCSDPSWSPDGEWITYIKWTLDDQHHRVYKIRRDGSQRVCLSGANTNFWPQFSFDNNFIVYQKDVGFYTHIFKVPADGGEEEALTSGEVDHALPQWSPSANIIVFVKQDSNRYYQIYKMDLSNGEETPLTDGEFDHLQPRFSPSGEYIIYIKSHPDSIGSQICRKPVSGGDEVALTDYSTLKEDPEWSPAGDLIVYVEYTGSDKGGKRISVIPAFPTAIKDYPDFIGKITCLPNPFSNKTIIRFANPQKRSVTFNIYNSCGIKVKTFTTKGEEIVWDGKDNTGKRLPAGIYFLRLEGKKENVKKLIITF